MIATLTDFALDTLVWTGALIALVLVLRRPVARWFGPQLAYALWLLPLLRFALPPLVLPHAFKPAAFAPVAGSSVPAAAGADFAGIATSAAPVEASFVLPWSLLLGSAWAIGAALFLWARWRDYAAMRRRLLAGAETVDLRDGIRLVETPAVSAPVAFGIRDKVIALPPRFLISGSLEERALAIAHEVAHHRGHDLLANWLAQPLLALHWFNPLAWTAWSAMRRDQEAACDARALAGRDAPTRARYARVIAGFAAPDRLAPRIALAAPMACPVLGDKSIIHRLRTLGMAEPSLRRRRAGRWVLAAGAAIAMPLTATVVYAGQDVPEVIDHTTAPVAPLDPAAPASPAQPEAIRPVATSNATHARPAALAARPAAMLHRDDATLAHEAAQVALEAEREARIDAIKAEAEARAAMHVALPAPAVAPRAPMSPQEVRRIVAQATAHVAPAITFASTGQGCEMLARQGHSGSRQIVRCAQATASLANAAALAGLKRARARMAADTDLSGEVRAEILASIDQSIADLQANGD